MNRQQRQLRQLKDAEHPFAPFVRILGKGKTGSRSLTEDEAYQAMGMILAGDVEDAQLGAFLMLLRVKEETHEELKGFVRAVRDAMEAPQEPIAVDLDWSSYAGKKRQLPWFILSACLLAGEGIRVFMHGAGGHTIGRLYTEDVLRELGLPVATDWQSVADALAHKRFVFMPLGAFSPVLQRIIDLRNYLGLRSPVHTLSRQINPLAAASSIQSIFHPAYADHHQQTAVALRQGCAAVFKGEGGEVERKPEAVCLIKYVKSGSISEELWPKLLDGRQPQPETLDIQELPKYWAGEIENSYAEAAVIGTAAIALRLLNHADSPEAAINLATTMWHRRNQRLLLPA